MFFAVVAAALWYRASTVSVAALIRLAVVLVDFLMVGPTSVFAQDRANNIKVFGANVPARGGAFVPAGTKLACFAINAGRCWDGKNWHELLPAGARKYAVPTSNEVTCTVIADDDCWTGTEWYRLPRGRLFGRTVPARGWAFVTAPLR